MISACLWLTNPSLRCFFIQIVASSYNRKSSIQDIAFFSEKLPCLNQERNMHRLIIVYKWKQFETVINKYVGGFLMWEWTLNLSQGSAIFIFDRNKTRLWGIEVLCVHLSVRFKVISCKNDMIYCRSFIEKDYKFIHYSFVFIHVKFSIAYNLPKVYCDVLSADWISFWRHPFTAEDTLVSKWCNATFLQICL